MKQLVWLLDYFWNIRFIKGHRKKIAKTFLLFGNAYQALASYAPLIKLGLDLPDIPTEFWVALNSYFALKIETFAKEHAT